MSVAENTKHISENRGKIFTLENQVLYNRSLAHATRALVTENGALINKNYQAAFVGNRQLANQNTDDVLRNRYAIIRNIPAKSQVETNYREALTNQARLEFLDHRSKLNERVLKVTEQIQAANRSLINVNRDIMDSNETIAQFNKTQIEKNTKLIAEGADASKATPEGNAAIISHNSDKIKEIQKRSEANKERINSVFESAKNNRTAAVANSEAIMARRERILENHRLIAANQAKVAAFISKL